MSSKRVSTWGIFVGVVTLSFATAVNASTFTTVIVDDNFADGDRMDNGGPLESSFFNTSSSSGLEATTGSLGLVTGSSGRAIHTLFADQTLVNSGDSITASFTFTTPASVAQSSDSTEELRFGLFDNLGRTSNTELGTDIVSSSSGTPGPNPLLNGLPGFAVDVDIRDPTTTDPATDVLIRRSDPSTSGQLLNTSGGLPSIGSGPDVGFIVQPLTEYTATISILLNDDDDLEVTGTFVDTDGTFLATNTEVDEDPLSTTFGFFGIAATGFAFGISNDPNEDANGDPEFGLANDNGIEISNVTIEFSSAIPEPSSMLLLLTAASCSLIRSRRA